MSPANVGPAVQRSRGRHTCTNTEQVVAIGEPMKPKPPTPPTPNTNSQLKPMLTAITRSDVQNAELTTPMACPAKAGRETDCKE